MSAVGERRHHASCACCERSVCSFLTLLRRYVGENQSLTSLTETLHSFFAAARVLSQAVRPQKYRYLQVCAKQKFSWHSPCFFTQYELPMPTLRPIHNGQSVPSHERRSRCQTTRHDGLLLLLRRRAKTWASYRRDLSARVTRCGALSTKLYLGFTTAAHRPTLRSAHLQPSAKNPSGAK
jgi:hypothetical protein